MDINSYTCLSKSIESNPVCPTCSLSTRRRDIFPNLMCKLKLISLYRMLQSVIDHFLKTLVNKIIAKVKQQQDHHQQQQQQQDDLMQSTTTRSPVSNFILPGSNAAKTIWEWDLATFDGSRKSSDGWY